MSLAIPEVCLVVLVGPSGSGKSSFASRHFAPTEVLSSDRCRGLVSDDETSQSATPDAFDVLHYVAGKRLANLRLTVVDATNVRPEDRKPLVELARRHDCLPVAIVLDLDPKICEERNRGRPDRAFGAHVVRQQSQALRRSLRSLKREGFRVVGVLSSPEEIDAVRIERVRLWTNRRDDHGPFDLIGDVHGCFDELVELLTALGYGVSGPPESPAAIPPAGRKAVFLGDLVDRGPSTPRVLRLVMTMVEQGVALCVQGNHEKKLLRHLRGERVAPTHGLAESIAQLDAEPADFRARVAEFLDALRSHYVLDDGKLVVAHAGLKEELQGRASARVREFALYGETTGETDELGLPVRHDWAREYRGAATVVYGHTPVPEPEWVNRTLCIDTGCVFGGRLTALRYPERAIVSVDAKREHYAPVRPIAQAAAGARDERDGLLDAGDVLGKRIVSTRVHRTVTIREENAAAALEVMSRFAIDPRWLVYLPPTMSPPETCSEGEHLEHPREAFRYYREHGVARVVCEEKHMGSRAVVVLCRSERAAAERFGAAGRLGVVHTRTGRPFFDDRALEAQLLDRLRGAAEACGLWDELATSWMCLDVEILPWSSKAHELLRSQYAAAGCAARHALGDAVEALRRATERTGAAGEVLARYERRERAARSFVDAYRRYCWTVRGLDDLAVAPFHLLASEGHVHTDRDQLWHLATLAKLCRADELLRETAHRVVDLSDDEDEACATAWWQELTDAGGEGMVVKPLPWLAWGERGLLQPAIKCRGREYLRIIYGPEYTAPEHLERLRERAVHAKRSLALRELALGLEALHRFVEREPLYRVHECVFGVLALESEPIDPRL